MREKDLFSILTVVCLRVFVFVGAKGSLNIAYGKETNNRGVTLVELIIVISVIAVLAIALGFTYADWMGKYKVEKVIDELYADLMNVRDMAMTRNSYYFVDFNVPAPPAGNGAYRLAEDTDDDGEGDGDADGVIDAGHTFLQSFPKSVEYAIETNFENKIINFDRRGIVQPRGQALGGTICLFTDNNPDYDCIVISQTRINMGKLIKQQSNGGKCKADNCVTK